MQLLSINHCESGMKLSRDIYNSNGSILVGNGAILSQRLIERLNELNINSIYVEHKKSKDIFVKDIISKQTKQEAIDFVLSIFDDSQKNPQEFCQVIAGKQICSIVQEKLSSLIYKCKNNSTVMNLLATVCTVDKNIFVHSFHVMIYTVLIGSKMGLNEEQILDLGLGAILHDVGKILIPTEILNKPDKLTNEEYDMIKTHTSKGFELLQQQPDIPELVAQCTYQHHERMDGKGYPRKLHEANIHLYAKIIAVCDVFEALTSHRVYRKPMLPNDAMEFLFAGSGTQFCQKVLQAFRNSISLYPVGFYVTLSSGYSGVIVRNNPGMPSRPIVRILENEDHVKITPFEVDLSSELNLVISDCKELA